MSARHRQSVRNLALNPQKASQRIPVEMACATRRQLNLASHLVKKELWPEWVRFLADPRLGINSTTFFLATPTI